MNLRAIEYDLPVTQITRLPDHRDDGYNFVPYIEYPG